jgi:thiamine biosynthesis lipoprotein
VEAAFAKAEEVNAVASDYLPASELSMLSSKTVGTPVPLSPLLFDLLDHSRRIAEATSGAFDPTLGPAHETLARNAGKRPSA